MRVDVFNLAESKSSLSKTGANSDFDWPEILNMSLAVFLAIWDGKLPKNTIQEMFKTNTNLRVDVACWKDLTVGQ